MIKITTSYGRKTPGNEPYSSESTHLTVEVELPDEVLRDQAEFKQTVRRLFAQARAEVEEQAKAVPAPPSNGNGAPPRRSGQPASPRQVDFLLSLGRRNANMSPADILREAGVEKLTDLTKAQASALIDRFNQKGAA